MDNLKQITRKEALSLGLKRYFTGKACVNGHTAERLCSTRVCVKCACEAAAAWRAERPETISVRARKYYEKRKLKNIEEMREQSRRRNAIWREKNKDKKRVQAAEWRKNNPDLVRKYAAKYRSDKLSATPKWLTREQLADIDLAYSVAAELERTTGIKYHVDHMVPLRGDGVCGLHVPWNLQAIPADDNFKKSNRRDD